MGAAEASGPGALVAPAVILQRPDADILLLQLRLNGRVLSEVLATYPSEGGGVVVPLGELCRLLELPVKVSPRQGRAEGSLLAPGQTFRLDAAGATARVKDRELAYPRSWVEVHEDDLYVDTRLLAQWLPLEAKLDGPAALLDLVTREPFPVQERWEREHRQIRTPEDPALRFKGYQRVEDPYRFASIPWVDQSLSLQHTSRSAPGQRSTQLAGQTFLGGDFLWMTASAFADYRNPGGLQNHRLTLGRRDPEGGLLGPLDAKEFQFGDTFAPGMGLASISAVGKGFFVSSFPLEAQGSDSRRSFVGELPSGWQVELYQNGALIGFQTARPDGRYQFLDQSLQFGPNDFRLVFYGPGGERKEEVFRTDLRELQTPTGTFRYRLAGVETLGGPKRGGFEGEYGLSPAFVLQGSALRLGLRESDARFSPAGTELRTYLQGALKAYGDRAVGTLALSRDTTGGGSAAQITVETGFGHRQSLVFRHAQLWAFASEVFRPDYGPIRSRTALILQGSLPDLARPWGSYQLAWQREALVAGGHHDELGNRLSVSAGPFTFSNTLAWTRVQERPLVADVSQVNGALLASRSFGTWAMRGQATYLADARGQRLTDTAVFADSSAFRPFQVQAGLSRSPDTGNTRVMVNLGKYTGRFSLGLNLAYGRAEGFQSTLNLHVGLSRNPGTGAWRSRAESVGGFGGVQARAFQDRNGNGRRDPGEPFLDNMAMDISGVSTEPASGDTFFSDRLPADRYAYVSLRESSLEDPLAKPTAPGFKLLPRSARVVNLEVPVVNFGQVNGSVYLDSGGAKRPFAGLQVELVNAQGQVAYAVRSAYDGFFSLDGVKPGRYRMRISPEDLERLELEGPKARDLEIAPTGTVLENADLLVRSLRPGLAPAPIATPMAPPLLVQSLAPAREPASTSPPSAPPSRIRTGLQPTRNSPKEHPFRVSHGSPLARPNRHPDTKQSPGQPQGEAWWSWPLAEEESSPRGLSAHWYQFAEPRPPFGKGHADWEAPAPQPAWRLLFQTSPTNDLPGPKP